MQSSSTLLRLALGVMVFTSTISRSLVAQQKTEQVRVDASGPVTPFPHFWEQTFGSGRAILSLRQSYREDIRTVKHATDFRSVRFHGIFLDEVGLYDPDATTQNPGLAPAKVSGASVYNFSYIDQIYDGLLAEGVRPFVELSFMPKKMAADPNQTQSFFYRPVVSPPKDYAVWDAMITAFARHLIERYGIDEVATWEFEVWNEPNLDFWGGRPNMPTYYVLYGHTAKALKQASERIRVGGPATAQAAYVGEFLRYTKEHNLPVDFVSTHAYGNDTADNVLKSSETVPRDQMVYRAVKKVHEEIVASSYPTMPLIFSEYNASYANEPNVTDSIYMGPWMANNIRLCDGLTASMSYWSFSDVFEEQGVVRTPFYGGYGLIAADGIAKPALNAFAMLHELGDQRIAVRSDSVLATKSADGDVEVAVWNYVAPYGEGSSYTPTPADAGATKSFALHVAGVAANAAVRIERLDADHGNVVKAFDAMGRPATPTREQIARLRAAGKAAPAEQTALKDGVLQLLVAPQGLVLVKVLASGSR